MTWQDQHNDRISRFPEVIRKVHAHSSNHRKEVEGSDICGCFYCCNTFRPSEILEWVDENNEGVGQCALCPKCGIDSVIGSLSGFPIDEAFLTQMRCHWF